MHVQSLMSCRSISHLLEHCLDCDSVHNLVGVHAQIVFEFFSQTEKPDGFGGQSFVFQFGNVFLLYFQNLQEVTQL